MISLRIGLNWLIGLLLAATLLINLGIQLMHAGPRVRAEAGSNLRLAREFVLESIGNLPDQADPVPVLKNLFSTLGNLRHVQIHILRGSDAIPSVWLNLEHDPAVPAWFVGLVGAKPRVITVPLVVGARDFGKVVIISNPLDELQEIWSDMIWLASISIAVTFIILIFVLILLRFALSPFEQLQSTLSDLEAGKWDVRLIPRGAIEFRKIASALNSLASTLDKVRIENRQLVSELFDLQDRERKEIARDLHDEAGPCLFSIRAATSTLQDLLLQPSPERKRVVHLTSVIDQSSESLQNLFRGLLGRLRPQGLDEIGLDAALRTLFSNWGVSHPEVSLRLNLCHDFSSLDPQTSSAAYRVVQEGVTNIFRHSRADRAEVSLSFTLGNDTEDSDGEMDGFPQLLILITDNGVGIPERPRPGIGLLGMRERVQALGGSFSVSRLPDGGTRVTASIPVSDEDDP